MKTLREFEPIHIVGIGGIGMSAIAEVLHQHGVKVRGTDLKDGVNTRRLAAKGIPVTVGHTAENVGGAGLVVLSSAVKSGNPELVAAKATDKRIEFVMDFRADPDRAFTDASAAKQVVLNLCLNAIQAVESHPNGERWVKVATRNVPSGVEMSTVPDRGAPRH